MRSVIFSIKPQGLVYSNCACNGTTRVVSDIIVEEGRQAESLLRLDNLPFDADTTPLIRNDHVLYVPVDEQYTAVMDVHAITAPLVLNRLAIRVLEMFSQPTRLPMLSPFENLSLYELQTVTAQLYEAGLLNKAKSVTNPWSFINKAPLLETWLYLSRTCNLECPYCFVRQDSRSMTLETGRHVIDCLFNLALRKGYAGVLLKYFGGEPIMNWNLIPALHQKAKNRALETNLRLIEVIITNATLLEQTHLEFIRDEGLQLNISLDGWNDNDGYHLARTAPPISKRVLKAIELALKMGLSPTLLTTVTRLNQEEITSLAAFALQHHLYLHLSLYRSRQPNDPLLPDVEQLIESIQKACNFIASNLPDYDFTTYLMDCGNLFVPRHCSCGAGDNGLSIDVDGNALPCSMLTGYNMPGISLTFIESAHFQDFTNPTVDQRTGCNTCTWRYWCGGGCPVHTRNVFGRSDVPSPYCEVYKAILPELARLQGLQLLRTTQQERNNIEKLLSNQFPVPS